MLKDDFIRLRHMLDAAYSILSLFGAKDLTPVPFPRGKG